VNEVKDSMKDQLTANNAEFTIDFERAPTISFSKKNLYSIFYNLISNAIKYRHPDRDPQIKLVSEQLDNYIKVTVQDNGLGFSEDNLSKVFTLFKRFHSHVEGTGMGLYIVKRLMSNAGGNVSINSTLGEGSIFKLYFRLGQEEKGDVALEADNAIF
jgi:two-component system, chemotaxis family, CheB/CheR fusion protein